jgi:hypothetical protein
VKCHLDGGPAGQPAGGGRTVRPMAPLRLGRPDPRRGSYSRTRPAFRSPPPGRQGRDKQIGGRGRPPAPAPDRPESR